MKMQTVFAVAAVTAAITGCAEKQQVSPSSMPSAPSAVSTSISSANTQQAAPVGTVPQQSEKPLAPEKNPLGDIPDNQAFVVYSSQQGHYSFKAPEGWARSEQGSDVSFVDKYDGVKVTLEPLDQAPTAVSVKNKQAADLVKNGRAVKIKSISDVKLPGGNAVWIQYESNSEPNPVTNKQIRQENENYIFFSNGTAATLSLWAPLGADNVDQWKLMSESFRWN